MSKLVILDLHERGVEDVIQVFVEVGQEGKIYEKRSDGLLEDNPRLWQAFETWQTHYRSLAGPYRAIKLKAVHREGRFEFHKQKCQKLERELEQAFHDWLRSPSFQRISNLLRENLDPQDEIRLLIRTDDTELRRLPWQRWELLNSYPQAEIVLSAPTSNAQSPDKAEKEKVRILAVLGNDDSINTQEDGKFLTSFSPDAEVTFLVKPTAPELQDKLWHQPWDLFFFAGHSRTEGEQGILCLNDQDFLDIQDLQQGLKRAVRNGLEVAIFNSCDGLGLARALEQMDVPNLIVMKEPVPDAIAQQFLKDLLSILSTQEIPLHLAVREAREKLQLREDDYPCASGLPVLCQNPTTPSPTWRSLRTGGRIGGSLIAQKVESNIAPISLEERLDPLAPYPLWLQKSIVLFVASLIMTGLVFVIRWSGWLEPYELNAYDHLMQVQWKTRPEPTDDKLLLVIHDGNEPLPNIQNMEFRGTQSIPDQAFDLAAKKLYEKFSPLAVGFMNVQPDSTDNYISEEEYPELVSRLKDEDGNLFTVCQMPTDGNAGKGSILNSNRNHVGLANFLDDNSSGDKLLRRQLISNNNSTVSECTPQLSISALISFFYSQAIKNIDIQETENKNIDDRQLQFAARLLPRLTNEAGGYSRSIDAKGSYQLLLNYRRTEDLERPTDIISLSQLLDDEIDSERIKTYQDRIVLIGSTVPTDPHVTVHATPYKNSRGERIEIPGLIANAHMISQLVHWIDGDRPLIKWWQVWQESFWILLWASIGGMSVLKPFKPLYISIFSVLAITGLSLLCNYAMKYGWWIPIVPPAIALLGTPILSVYLSVRYLRRSWQE